MFKIAGSNRNNVSVCLGFLLRILLAKLDHLINFNGRIVLEKVEPAAINHDVPNSRLRQNRSDGLRGIVHFERDIAHLDASSHRRLICNMPLVLTSIVFLYSNTAIMEFRGR